MISPCAEDTAAPRTSQVRSVGKARCAISLQHLCDSRGLLPDELNVFEEALRILCGVEHGREGELRVARGEDDDGLGPGGLVQVVDLSDQVVST